MIYVLTALDTDTNHTEVVALGATRSAACQQAVDHLRNAYSEHTHVENIVGLIFGEEREYEDEHGHWQYDSICDLSTDTEGGIVPVIYTVTPWFVKGEEA